MKRLVISAGVLAVLSLALPAGATHRETWRDDGVVRLSVNHPTVARALYERTTMSNGLVGYVMRLPATADGAAYTLTRTDGVGNVDAWFYDSISTTPSAPFGVLCNLSVSSDSDETERGRICPESARVGRWLIVVLRFGLDAEFEFSYNATHG